MTYDGFCDGFYSGVALSKDIFHEPIPEINELLLRTLHTFRTDKFTDWYKSYVQENGRGKTVAAHYAVRTMPHSSYALEVELSGNGTLKVTSSVLLSVTGNLLSDCDYAYEDESQVIVGNVCKGVTEALMKYIGVA